MDPGLRTLERASYTEGPIALHLYQRTLCRRGEHASERVPNKEYQLVETSSMRPFVSESFSDPDGKSLRIKSNYTFRCSACEKHLGETPVKTFGFWRVFSLPVDEAFPKGITYTEEDEEQFFQETVVEGDTFWFPRAWATDWARRMPKNYYQQWWEKTWEVHGMGPAPDVTSALPTRGDSLLQGAMYSNLALLLLVFAHPTVAESSMNLLRSLRPC